MRIDVVSYKHGMAVVHSAGVPIHYEVLGSGPPIVLVHGFLSSFEANWGQTGWIQFLEQQGRAVIGLDCRAHGESGKPHDPAAYTIQQMADDVTTVMDAAGVHRADLMGYSMGGRLVLELLVRAPSRFTSAVIGGSGLPGPGNPELRAAIIAALQTEDMSTISNPTALFFRQFAESRAHDPGSVATRDPDLKALAMCFSTFSQHRGVIDVGAVAQVPFPLLAVAGDKDAELAAARQLVEVVPNAELVVVPGGDHLSVIPSQTYKDAVASFLARAQ